MEEGLLNLKDTTYVKKLIIRRKGNHPGTYHVKINHQLIGEFKDNVPIFYEAKEDRNFIIVEHVNFGRYDHHTILSNNLVVLFKDSHTITVEVSYQTKYTFLFIFLFFSLLLIYYLGFVKQIYFPVFILPFINIFFFRYERKNGNVIRIREINRR